MTVTALYILVFYYHNGKFLHFLQLFYRCVFLCHHELQLLYKTAVLWEFTVQLLSWVMFVLFALCTLLAAEPLQHGLHLALLFLTVRLTKQCCGNGETQNISVFPNYILSKDLPAGSPPAHHYFSPSPTRRKSAPSKFWFPQTEFCSWL